MTKSSFEPAGDLSHNSAIGVGASSMGFLAELFAVIVLWLSALALSQFGMALERPPERPAKSEKSVNRTPQKHAAEDRISGPCAAAPRIRA